MPPTSFWGVLWDVVPAGPMYLERLKHYQFAKLLERERTHRKFKYTELGQSIPCHRANRAHRFYHAARNIATATAKRNVDCTRHND